MPIAVKDVAEVGIGSQFRTGASTMNGEEAVVCWVMMLSGANSRVVAQQGRETERNAEEVARGSRRPHGLQSQRAGQPHHPDGGEESFRRRDFGDCGFA